MSYLDLPRLYFSGQFMADPSTLNNTPNNYNSNHTFPTDATISDGLFTPGSNDNNIDLFWNPNGTGTCGFVDCTVQQVSYLDGDDAVSAGSDPIIGQSVSSNPDARGHLQQAKIVDLDPMQQNVSEIWGLNVSIGDVLCGDFVEAAFVAIWLQAKGVPPGDTAGAAVYQSILTNVTLADSDLMANSRFLSEIAGEQNLSISFVVRAVNSRPQNYLVSKETMQSMAEKGVPQGTLEKLSPLMSYAAHPTSPAGRIPTKSYFRKLLRQLTVDAQYVEKITACAEQPYTWATPYDFVHGQIAGTIGLQAAHEPVHFSATRMMAPNPNPAVPNKFGVYDPLCNYAPFKVIQRGDQSSVALNLGNSLPTNIPASAFDAEKLGTLRLCYFDVGHGEKISIEHATLLPGAINYRDTSAFFNQRAGLVDLPIDSQLVEKPLGLVQVDAAEKVAQILLQEDAQGDYLRADKFVFRMQPGSESAEQSIDFYVTAFGRPKAGASITVALVSPEDAVTYTNMTPGTGGSPGVNNVSIPQSAIQIENANVTTDADGKATVTVTASDPGNPRDYLDGQIYFLQYKLDSAGDAYIQSPDDVISIQVYQQDPQSLLIPENNPETKLITWNNGVRDILAQYGKLYPIMSFLPLTDYQGLIKPSENRNQPSNLDLIRTTLQASLSDPSHMPVTRDLSSSRKAVILSWIENGTPE